MSDQPLPQEPLPAGPLPSGRLAGLLSLGLLVGTINGLSRVALPLYAAALGAHAWQVGIVGGLGYAGMLLLAMPVGAWIDRHGSRTIFLRGAAAAALVYLALPFAHSPELAIVATASLGLILPFRTVPAHTEFLALVPLLSAGKAGWNRAANTTGMFFIGPAISAAVVAAFGFAAAFRLAAAGLLVAWLVGRRVFVGGAAHAVPHGPTILARVKHQLGLLWSVTSMRRTLAIDFLTQMAVAYFVVFGIVLAVRHFGLSLQAAAGLITMQGALFVVTSLAGGAWLLKRHEESRYLLAFVLLFAYGLIFGFGESAALLWLGAALMGVGVGIQGLTSINRFAALMQQHGRGRVAGLSALAAPAGGVIGTMLGGAMSQRWGIELGFRLMAIAYGALCLSQMRRMWLQHKTVQP